MRRHPISLPLAIPISPKGWNMNSPGWMRHETTRGSTSPVGSTPDGVESRCVFHSLGLTPSGVVFTNVTVHLRLHRGLFTLKPVGLPAKPEIRA